MERQPIVPYDTGKVKIGCMYTPPPRVVDMGVHAELLQRALLGIRMTWYEWLKLKFLGP